MSFYGAKTFGGLFSVHKKRLAGNQSHRFGGAHAHIAYSVDGQEVPVTNLESGVQQIQAGASDVVSVVLMGTKMDTPATFSNLAFLDIVDSATIAPDAYGVVLEGSVVVGADTLDAATDIHLIQPGSVVTGAGKLVTFTFVQN